MTNQAVSRAGDSRRVVADAGPLIHLDELDQLELLADFPEVLVSEAVWREIERHRPRSLRKPGIPLLRCSPSASAKVAALAALYTLHAGEHEALCLCQAFPGALLLTDDTAARLAAKTLAVEAHGTLGLLVRHSASPIEQDARSGVIEPDIRTFHVAHSPDGAVGNHPAGYPGSGTTMKLF